MADRISIRVCRLCKKELPIFEFGRIKNSSDPFNKRCKKCIKSFSKETELSKISKRVKLSDPRKFR